MEKRLLKKIERLRKKLNEFGLRHNLIDPEVVELSQQLDLLLNQYQEIRNYRQLSLW